MLPNLVVIGAQKCGTSALHYYLSLHPEVSMSRPKELNFFISQRNWDRGIGWYEGHFRNDTKLRGESSTNYTNYPHFKGVARRMHSVIPDAKLIYLVRDPIERIVSAYLHHRAAGRVEGDLTETVLGPGGSYIRRSRYHRQVGRFMRFYPRSRLLVVEQRDLLEERRETLQEVFRFLGVDDSFWSNSYERLRHQTAHKKTPAMAIRELVFSALAAPAQRRPALPSRGRPAVSDELRRELTKRLKPDIDRFRSFTGREFAHWSI